MKLGSLINRKRYPIVLSSGNHPMNNTMIERRILEVARRLSKNGYQAFFVGGCVRDIFLGKKPKDFDIATDAHPRQIKRLFSRCYLIGRRFRLAHVYITSDRFIEVATFRAAIDPEEPGAEGFNTFGTLEEDALRRDFTINALYYNPDNSSVVDYTGGLEDIKKRIIRSIGEPSLRFREDPVRMIRAARFCAQLGFRLSGNDYKAAIQNAHLIETANQNRLLDELYKILRCGSAAETIAYLRRFKLLAHWLPQLSEQAIHPALHRRLTIIDLHRFTGQEIPNCVLISCLFYDLFTPVLDKVSASGNIQEAFIAIRDNFQSLAQHIRLPKNEWNNVCNIVARQIILSRPVNAKNRTRGEIKFISNQHFNDSLLLFTVLCETTNTGNEELSYWKNRAATAAKTENENGHNQKQSHNHRSRIEQQTAPVPEKDTSFSSENADAVPRKKRRKRRRR